MYQLHSICNGQWTGKHDNVLEGLFQERLDRSEDFLLEDLYPSWRRECACVDPAHGQPVPERSCAGRTTRPSSRHVPARTLH